MPLHTLQFQASDQLRLPAPCPAKGIDAAEQILRINQITVTAFFKTPRPRYLHNMTARGPTRLGQRPALQKLRLVRGGMSWNIVRGVAP